MDSTHCQIHRQVIKILIFYKTKISHINLLWFRILDLFSKIKQTLYHLLLWYKIIFLRAIKRKFHWTDTNTDTDTDLLADFRTRILLRKSAYTASADVGLPRGGSRPATVRTARSARWQSSLTFVRRMLFFARMSVGDARMYTCTCTVQDKLSCTY